MLQGAEDSRAMLPGGYLPWETRRWSYCPNLPWLKLTARLGLKLPQLCLPL